MADAQDPYRREAPLAGVGHRSVHTNVPVVSQFGPGYEEIMGIGRQTETLPEFEVLLRHTTALFSVGVGK